MRKHLGLALLGITVLIAANAGTAGAASARTCSLATMKNDFSIIVTGPSAWQTCRSLRRSWNTASPSETADGQFLARSGRYKQFQTSQVCVARHAGLTAAVWDSGLGWIGDDVCKDLVRRGWNVTDTSSW